MKKWIAFVLVLAVILAGCWVFFVISNTEDVHVFETENITAITFHADWPGKGEYEVPDEHMDDITAWLGSVVLLQKLNPGDIAAGSYVSVELEYADGTVVHQNMDIVTVDGVLYSTRYDDFPPCYYEILELND